MIIDGHSHAFGEFGRTERLIPLMDRLGVDKVVLCPSGTEPDIEFEVPRISYSRFSRIAFLHIFGNIFFLRGQHKGFPIPDNEYVYSMVKEYPERLLQYYWIKPHNKEMLSSLEEDFERMSFAGIKLHQCLTMFSNNDEEVKFIVKFAGEKNLPVFIHLYNFKEIKRFVKLAKEFPETNFIMAHLMGFEIAARRGKNLKNLYFDISPYFIISERRIKKALKIFGDDKVLLGSDSPVGEGCLEYNIRKIKNMALTDIQKNKILGDNLAELLNL
jgi:predicted TIM-barrel fold metal-dependent hydrolase